MENKKTTIAGYIMLVASVLTVAARILTGGDIASAIPELLTALGGVGLITAKDGGH